MVAQDDRRVGLDDKGVAQDDKVVAQDDRRVALDIQSKMFIFAGNEKTVNHIGIAGRWRGGHGTDPNVFRQ